MLQALEWAFGDEASCGVGRAAVQVPKETGAHVTGVQSAGHIGLVRALGADEVVDDTRTDMASIGDRSDACVEAVGTSPYSRCSRVLRPHRRASPWSQISRRCLTRHGSGS